MNKIVAGILLIFVLSSFYQSNRLNGIWEFEGGIYNGKKEGATDDYSLQRKYAVGHFDAFLIEKGSKKKKYQSGNYVLQNGTYVETETYSSEPSRLTNIPVRYQYELRHDTLILRSVLPTGMKVEEYWKKIK